MRFDNGDRLIINHKGCEYYVLSFQFESSYYPHDPSDLPFWFKTAEVLLGDMAPALDAPINIKKRAQQFKSYIQKHQSLSLGKEIDVGGNVIRNFISADHNKKIQIAIRFFGG